MKTTLYSQSIDLLKELIVIPSLSGQENETGDLIEGWLEVKGVEVSRIGNNIWAKNRHFDIKKPTILLNSHHDTVSANAKYTRNPYEAEEVEGKIYGLGSNDAGGCLVALIASFMYYYEKLDLAYNIIIAATAEEENSGENGIRSILQELPEIDFAIVGEPTEMQLAISEKGLLVIDGYAEGISGHAAHGNTINAIYEAMVDLDWIKKYDFVKSSETLGKVKMSVTQIVAGSQHNVVPASCHFVLDVRINDAYTNKEVFQTIDENTRSKLMARSFKHNSSSISTEHPIVLSGIQLGRETYGSPTMSDQTALRCPSVKLGPGISTRSHTADEYIYRSEIIEGIELYIKILEPLLIKY